MTVPLRRRDPERGFAYVAILVILMLITTMGIAFVHKAGVEASASMSRGGQMQAQYLAEAGAHHAMWRLLNEPAFPAAENVYYMHSLGAGRYGYKVHRHTGTTFATVASVGATEHNVVQQSYVLYVLPPMNAMKNFLVYGPAGDSIPKYREYTDAGWTAPGNTVDIGALEVKWMELQGSSIREEAIMGARDKNEDVNLVVWDGSSWGNLLELSINAKDKSFDIAYESLSGDALAVSREGIGSMLKYTIWDGTQWVLNPPANAFDTSGGEVKIVVMESDPFSDEILIAVLDKNNDIFLFQWDGNGFNSLGTLETNATNNKRLLVDIAYERQSGDALIVWGRLGSNSPQYRLWDGSSLSAEASLPSFGNQSELIRLAADPTSDQILAAAIDGESHNLNIALWDGDAWTDSRTPESNLRYGDRFVFDVAWEGLGNQALVAWGLELAPFMRNFLWTKGTSLASGTIQDGPIGQGDTGLVELFPLSGEDSIVTFAVLKSKTAKSFYSAVWNGDSFGPTEQLDADLAKDKDVPFAITQTRDSNP